MTMDTLRWLLPRLPLPMLALAASYGVYQFALLFVPWWVAAVQASAFEMTYIGLAIIEARQDEQRKRATTISVGAVVVSVLYNSLAGFFHRNGLGALPLAGEIILATLHGAPLAIVAYLVADLLLHNEVATPAASPAPTAGEPLPAPTPLPASEPQPVPASPAPRDSSGSTWGLPDWLDDEGGSQELLSEQEEVAEESATASDKLPLSLRVTAILNKRPDLSNEELYAILSGDKPKSIRVYSSAWRKERLATVSPNGKH